VVDCTFFRRQADGTLRCKAALNFSLESASYLDRCRSCEVPALSRASHCRHLILYSFLTAGPGGRRRVAAAMACGLEGSGVDLAECATCAHYEGARPDAQRARP